MFSCFRPFACAFAAVVAARLTAADAPPLPALEAFFSDESIRQMALSPDGNKIALVAPNHGRYSVGLLDTTTGKTDVIVHLEDENVREIFWRGNDRILFKAQIEGNEVPLWASTDLKGKSVKRLLEPRVRQDDFSIFQGDIVDTFPGGDEHILIYGFTGEDDPRKVLPGSMLNPTPAIYKVDVKNGRRSMVVGMDEFVSIGVFDSDAQQRFVFHYKSTTVTASIRASNSSAFRKLRSFDSTAYPWNPEGMVVLADKRTLLLVDYSENDRGQLRSLDLDTGDLGPVIFAPAVGEITNVITSPKRGRLLGVRYEDSRRHTHWVDPKWAKIGALLERSFPDHVVTITSMSDDEKRFLFVVYSDRDPGRYFLGDLRGGSFQVQPLSAVRPAIKPELMSPMAPIQFPARDGLTINGYLTKPKGAVDARTPLLVMPHGGPFGERDSWGFQPDAQFLASRGYAILQVNYRGSGGYGTAFEHAGYREWGGKMQDDLTDAVKWCLAQGWGDPARVGIIGASYGGYAALAGVTFTPELYRVGINYVGVSDLRLITRWDTARTVMAEKDFALKIGRETRFLAEHSPVNYVANIRVPTLHAYGDNDPRVVIANWTGLEAQLKKHGKIYEAIVEQREGHGFEKADASIRFYRRVATFLAKYMPADSLVEGGSPGTTPAAQSGTKN